MGGLVGRRFERWKHARSCTEASPSAQTVPHSSARDSIVRWYNAARLPARRFRRRLETLLPYETTFRMRRCNMNADLPMKTVLFPLFFAMQHEPFCCIHFYKAASLVKHRLVALLHRFWPVCGASDETRAWFSGTLTCSVVPPPYASPGSRRGISSECDAANSR